MRTIYFAYIVNIAANEKITMKRLTLSALSLLLAATLMGQINFGGGLETDLDQLGLSAKAQTYFGDYWGGQVGFTLYAASPHPTRIDGEAIYNFGRLGNSDQVKLNALAGLNYWNSGVKGTDAKLGLNAGGQVVFELDKLSVYVEPKFSIISNSNFLISAGVFF